MISLLLGTPLAGDGVARVGASWQLACPRPSAFAERQPDEGPDLPDDRRLGGEALDAAGAEEPGDAARPGEDRRRVLRLGDRAAVAEDEDVGADRLRGVGHRLDAAGGLV